MNPTFQKMVPLPVTIGLEENFVRCSANKDMTWKLGIISLICLSVVTVANGYLPMLFLFQTASVSIWIKVMYSLHSLWIMKTLIHVFVIGSIWADRGRLRMSVTYYFTGDCSEESVKDEIRQKFITTLSTSSYKDACLVYAKECNVDNVQVCTLVFVCLFVWLGFIVPLEKFSPIWRRHILTYARHSWPLSSEDSLMYHTYCDTGHPFIMAIFEDPWHTPFAERLAVELSLHVFTTLVGRSRDSNNQPSLAGELPYPLRHRRGILKYL